jgi:SAM-dependent methyltransferase
MVTLAVDLALPSAEARDALLDELELAGHEARVDGERIVLEWQPGEWEPTGHGLAELRLEPIEGGTRVTLELRREPDLLAAWFVSQAAAPLLSAASPEAYGDWLTDRRARRPSGAEAREVYADPLYHWPNFRAILHELALTAGDHLLEVGCGGGAFLHEALKSGCRAAAIDHSPDMVRLARGQNAEAIEAGRLEIVQGDAASLPFADNTFTAAVMTGVLGFLPDPVAAFAEIRRVLASGGRLIALGADPALKGTPAAPEPMASRLRFYTDEEHVRIGREAGLDGVRVERIPLDEYAREAGVPEEHLPLFEGPGAPFLIARKEH